jgi:hypothetical protein
MLTEGDARLSNSTLNVLLRKEMQALLKKLLYLVHTSSQMLFVIIFGCIYLNLTIEHLTRFILKYKRNVYSSS